MIEQSFGWLGATGVGTTMRVSTWGFAIVETVHLLGLALLLFLRSPAHWLGLARLWTVPLFTSGVALISWGSWRFRQPADAALLAFCVIAVAMMPRRGQAF